MKSIITTGLLLLKSKTQTRIMHEEQTRQTKGAARGGLKGLKPPP